MGTVLRVFRDEDQARQDEDQAPRGEDLGRLDNGEQEDQELFGSESDEEEYEERAEEEDQETDEEESATHGEEDQNSPKDETGDEDTKLSEALRMSRADAPIQEEQYINDTLSDE